MMDDIIIMASDDQEYCLSVFNAKVDATVKMWKAYTDYNKAMVEIMQKQVGVAASIMRLKQLKQAIREFTIAFTRCRQQMQDAEETADRIRSATRTASRLLTGRVPDDSRSLVWGSFWQIINLANPSAKIAIGQITLDGANALTYFQNNTDIPEVGSEKWTALGQIFQIIDDSMRVELEATEKKIAEREAALAELRKQRWDAVATVGITPAG